MGDIDEIRRIAEGYFDKSAAGHDWHHVERVYRMAVKIGKAEGADMSVLEPAALLHDIARRKEGEGAVECHAAEGARMARQILKEISYPDDKIEKIAYCIDVHRYRKQIKPTTLEAQALQDADRLDALGAICIGRCFTYGGAKGRPMYDPDIKPAEKYESKAATSMNHFFEKILKITPESFNTKTARGIAKERYAFVKGYVERFLKEWKGEI
jgi:uncharacterized protein